MSDGDKVVTIGKDKLPSTARSHRLRKLHHDARGREHLGGRWSCQRVADWLIEQARWKTLDDVARYVYGTTSVKLRDAVRKRVPKQRMFMLLQLEHPIVTQFGDRGRIERIKLYDASEDLDRMLFQTELDRALERKELTDRKYEYLSNLFLPGR